MAYLALSSCTVGGALVGVVFIRGVIREIQSFSKK